MSFTTVNVKDKPYGAKGDGITDDTLAIQAAIKAITSSGALVFPPGTYLCSSASFSIPAYIEVRFEQGGMLAPGTGVTITISGPVIAFPTQQIFYCTGTLSSVTPNGKAPPTVEVSGTPTGCWSFLVQIVSGGMLSTEITFRYSLNNGVTWIPALTAPPLQAKGASSYSYLILDAEGVTTGVTITFPAGTYYGAGQGQNTYAWTALPGTLPVALSAAASDRIFPNWWGAVGDGATDDTAALLACFAAWPRYFSPEGEWIGGGTIYFPPGIYLCSQELPIPAFVPLVIEGAGNQSSIIQFTGFTNGLTLRSSSNSRGNPTVIRDLGLTNSATLLYGLSVDGLKPPYTLRQPNQPHNVGDIICPFGASNRLLKCTASTGAGTTGQHPPFGKLYGGVTAALTNPSQKQNIAPGEKIPAISVVPTPPRSGLATAGCPTSGTLTWIPQINGTPGQYAYFIDYSSLTEASFLECTLQDAGAEAPPPPNQLSVGDQLICPAPYPWITGVSKGPYQQISIEIYKQGNLGGTVPGLGTMAFRWSIDGLTYTSPDPPGLVTTVKDQTAYPLHLPKPTPGLPDGFETDLTVNFPDANYVGGFYTSPPMGTGFSVIVGDTIYDGTLNLRDGTPKDGVTWEVIDGGVGILLENVTYIQVERCYVNGFIVGIVNDSSECVQIRDCVVAPVNGIWAATANERHTEQYACTTITDPTPPPGTINVVSTQGFPPSGQIEIPFPAAPYRAQVITYTNKTPTSFTGCSPVAGSLNTGWYVQCGILRDSGITNVHDVTGCQIQHNEIGIIDSGDINHVYRDTNFEGTGDIPASAPWYIWANYVQLLQISGLEAEGASGGIFLGKLLPFTGGLYGGPNEWVKIENSVWTSAGPAIEFWGLGSALPPPGFFSLATGGVLDILVERCRTGSNTQPAINNLTTGCNSAVFRNNYINLGLSGVFSATSGLGGLFVYEQSDDQSGVGGSSGPAACGVGVNCLPAVKGYDLACPLALRSAVMIVASTPPPPPPYPNNHKLPNPGTPSAIIAGTLLTLTQVVVIDNVVKYSYSTYSAGGLLPADWVGSAVTFGGFSNPGNNVTANVTAVDPTNGTVTIEGTFLTINKVTVEGNSAFYWYSSYVGAAPSAGQSIAFSGFANSGNNVTATLTAVDPLGPWVTVIQTTQAPDSGGSGASQVNEMAAGTGIVVPTTVPSGGKPTPASFDLGGIQGGTEGQELRLTFFNNTASATLTWSTNHEDLNADPENRIWISGGAKSSPLKLTVGPGGFAWIQLKYYAAMSRWLVVGQSD